jgi:riboflavin biosynthesis pyrimidine reductase
VEDQVSEVAAALAALYGPLPLLTRGVVHVTSAVRTEGGALRVIAIGPGAPKSASDFFVLNACRARADALLTTAAILRSEPTVVHSLQGPSAPLLTAYRRELLHKHRPPLCAILTRGGPLPLEHPVWSDGTDKLVLTTAEAAEPLRALLGLRAEVIALAELDARSALVLLAQRGHALVSVEAGPSTTGPLYQPPSVVDELLLSLFEGPQHGVQLGGELPADLLTGRVCTGESVRDEESGRWRFQRWQLAVRQTG